MELKSEQPSWCARLRPQNWRRERTVSENVHGFLAFGQDTVEAGQTAFDYGETVSSEKWEMLVILDNMYKDRLERLEREVAELRSIAGLSNSVPREVSDRQAIKEIKAYFEEHHGESLYPDDVAEALGLPIMQCVRLCRKLAEEGELAEA